MFANFRVFQIEPKVTARVNGMKGKPNDGWAPDGLLQTAILTCQNFIRPCDCQWAVCQEWLIDSRNPHTQLDKGIKYLV